MQPDSHSLDLDEVFSSQEPLSYPHWYKGRCIYLSSLESDASKSVLKARIGNESVCISPEGYSLRTKINEYGGKPFWLVEEGIIFSNQSDQCLYLIKHSDENLSCTAITRLTPVPSAGLTYMFSDIKEVSENGYLAIVELYDAEKGGSLNESFIGHINAEDPDSPPVRLVEGADFYSNLVIDECGGFAWVEWNHPNMPWDENSLYLGKLAQNSVKSVKKVEAKTGVAGSSYCQVAFNRRGDLFFSVDFSNSQGADNYWNVFVLKHGAKDPHRLTNMEVEFGYPHWQYGDARIVPLDVDKMLAIGSQPAGDTIYIIDPDSESVEPVYGGESTIQFLSSDEQSCSNDDDTCSLLCIETSPQNKPIITEVQISAAGATRDTLVSSPPYSHRVSRAVPVSYQTTEGHQTFGFYYSPLVTDDNALPPLMVMVHGGPTARAYAHFDIQKQYWCAKGFAILDVNHRGSSGYGRKFRDSLYGDWGVRDAEDIIAGINYLVDQGLVDKRNVFIRGKSAGGYAVLRALTEYPDVFNGGACYYGIGNLATLCEVTHKFEKHYTDRLIGEPYDSQSASLETSRYKSRSPIFYADKIKSSMIIFQGGEDKIVPPSVAHEMVECLKLNNVNYEYVEYPEEGHGFKLLENNIDAWSKELAFYQSLFV